jgi:hypothetical protein
VTAWKPRRFFELLDQQPDNADATATWQPSWTTWLVSYERKEYDQSASWRGRPSATRTGQKERQDNTHFIQQLSSHYFNWPSTA